MKAAKINKNCFVFTYEMQKVLTNILQNAEEIIKTNAPMSNKFSFISSAKAFYMKEIL